MNTKTQEALKMAIEFIETLTIDVGIKTWNEKHRKEIIQSCKEALEHLVQEPIDVARVQEDGYVEWRPDIPDLPVGTKLYTHPAQSWQPLSDAEIEKLANLLGFYEYISTLIEFVRTIEKHRGIRYTVEGI